MSEKALLTYASQRLHEVKGVQLAQFSLIFRDACARTIPRLRGLKSEVQLQEIGELLENCKRTRRTFTKVTSFEEFGRETVDALTQQPGLGTTLLRRTSETLGLSLSEVQNFLGIDAVSAAELFSDHGGIAGLNYALRGLLLDMNPADFDRRVQLIEDNKTFRTRANRRPPGHPCLNSLTNKIMAMANAS